MPWRHFVQQSDSVTLIDLQRMEAYRHVKAVGGPHEAAASPDGRTVVVTNYNKAGTGPQKTLSLIALPDNRHAFVTVRNDDSMLVLDLVSGDTLARVPVQSSPDGVTYSAVQR